MNKIKDFLSYVKSNLFEIIFYGYCILCAILALIAAFAPKTPKCSFCEERKATRNYIFEYSALCDSCYEHLEWYFLEDLFNDGSLEEFLNDMDVLLIHEAVDLHDVYAYGYFNGHLGIDGVNHNEKEEIINGYDYDKLKEYFESLWIWR